MKITREELDKLLYAVSNPRIKDSKLQTVYQAGVLAGWILRLARTDITIKHELYERLERRKTLGR